MKRLLLILMFLTTANFIFAQQEVNVITGANYADEVYYGFETGSVQTVSRSAWDIAFSTDQMEINILANNGNGIELYTYPNGDINDFGNALDISAVDTWPKMYNSIDSVNEGAFLNNIDPGNSLDFGWGIYNSVNHHIDVDSIFIIKLSSGTYKQLAIVVKDAVANQWTFKYADIDGTNVVTETFDADDYSTMNFIHYSIENGSFVSQEPNKNTWQLLFTRYYDYNIPYMVSGVLSKGNVAVQEVRQTGLNQATYNTFDENLFSKSISTIGSDWKSFNMGTYTYDIIDTVVYFVRELPDGAIWKLYFTGFGGSATGQYTFIQEKLTHLNVSDINKSFATVYPNPTSDYIILIYDIDGPCSVKIYNIKGQLVYSEMINNSNQLNKQRINIENLPAGIFNITVSNRNKVSSVKFIKK